MQPGKEKQELGAKISDWEEQLENWNNDLTTLDESAVIHLKLEYDLTALQQQIDSARQQAEYNPTVENFAAVAAGNETYLERKVI